VPLQARRDLAQLAIGLRQHALQLRDRPRRADARHHVFALRVLQELAVELPGARGRIAREPHAGGGVLPHVAEHHALDVHRGAEIVGDVVQLAVRDRARVHPGLEDGVARAAQLRAGVLGERLAGLALDHRLEALDHLGERGLAEVHVGGRLVLALHRGQLVLEAVLVDAEHDVAVHLEQPPIGVPGEAAVAGARLQARDRPAVQAQVQDRVHHARHRELGAAAHRDEQRVLRRAQALAHQLLEARQRALDLRVHLGRQAAAALDEEVAGGRRDREARRHRQARVGHLGQAGALAPEQLLHVPVAVGAAAPEEVHVLRHH
jgi:hypothetical protein